MIIEVVAALIWNNSKLLICQRPAHKTRGLLWEFVGGKVEAGENHAEALKRECREELGIDVAPENLFMDVTHVYSDITIHLSIYSASIISGSPQLLEHADLRWVTPKEARDYPFCPADEPILEKLQTL